MFLKNGVPALHHLQSLFNPLLGKCLLQTTCYSYRYTIFPSGSRLMRSSGQKVSGLNKNIKFTPKNETAPPTNGNASMQHLLKPLGFTFLVTGCSFAGAAVWQYETMHKFALSLQSDAWRHQQRTAFTPRKAGTLRQQLNFYWQSLPDGKRVALTIIGLNTLVFLAWRVPRWQPVMTRWFCSLPGSKPVCLPMMLSVFSHYNGFHFAANMYVLWSFSVPVVNMLGKEQFWAFYLTAGAFSSFASLAFKTLTKSVSLSLGASGAIMAMIAIVCREFPDAKLSIIFLPMFPFSADSALKGILLFEIAGLVLAFRLFDHAAHLGGAVFGIWYHEFGHKLMWQRREAIMSQWHKLRTKVSPPR